ncbi:hypothetical protein [Cerasicoccus fimbriatus]|uniref:hypothetical protein n=1 Tax=Cerasicoccus fimbriatus TaxID=3014554 RepID=UPI0022B2CD52|nr:hypothetical protein [Cerasicoccus sp. TK19100]
MKALLLHLTILLWACALSAQTRTWTDAEGRSFEGVLLSHTPMTVFIERTSDKRQFTIERSKLSQADNDFLDEMDRQQRVKEFLAKTPDSFEDAVKLSERKKLPAFIVYRNQEPEDKFLAAVDRLLDQPEFQAKIKGRAVLVVITQREDDLERRIGSWTAEYPDACRAIFFGSQNQSLGPFMRDSVRAKEDSSFKVFLADVEEQLTSAEENSMF